MPYGAGSVNGYPVWCNDKNNGVSISNGGTSGTSTEEKAARKLLKEFGHMQFSPALFGYCLTTLGAEAMEARLVSLAKTILENYGRKT